MDVNGVGWGGGGSPTPLKILTSFPTLFSNKFSGVGMGNPRVGNDFPIPTLLPIYLFNSKHRYMISIN